MSSLTIPPYRVTVGRAPMWGLGIAVTEPTWTVLHVGPWWILIDSFDLE